MKTESVDILKAGTAEASKILGTDVQEWFRQKYLLQSKPIEDKIYTIPSLIPKAKIYFGIYDIKNKPKEKHYDVFPIIFHIDMIPYKNVDNLMIGVNLNYFNSIKRAIFIDSALNFFQRYIEENKKRLLNGDLSQFSADGVNDFLNEYISNIGISIKDKKETYIWSSFRPGSVLPIDYDDWKWLPLLIPSGVMNGSLSKIQSI